MCPQPIRNDGELEQAIARLDDLDRRDQDLTSEERELAGCIRPSSKPMKNGTARCRTRLRMSSCARCWSSAAWPRPASPTRSTGKAQAKKLAEFFNLPAELFI
jgi:hypothetical protein